MSIPLSERLRPKSLSDVVGQDHLVNENGFITHMIRSNKPLSIILWGPPGSGKTTIAKLYAQAFSFKFEMISAIFSGVADLKKLLINNQDKEEPLLLFVDEIHRFNKSQQDAFLPFMESGKLILVGATVENPSFYLNAALLSRSRVLKLNALTTENLLELLKKYEDSQKELKIDEEARQYLVHLAQGDGRYLFNLVENLAAIQKNSPLTLLELENYFQKKSPLFDRGGDQHYNLISALHKSIRGSDPDASLYWLARILQGGEELLFVARRLIRVASEDVGLADPQSLILTIAARDACEMLGKPEAELALAEAVVYLALAPKSNAIYLAYQMAEKVASETAHLDPPYTILNAPTKMMKEMGYGKGYIYDHQTKEAFSGQNYFPDGLLRQAFYQPVERGFEREMKKRIEYFNHLKKKNNSN